jgi:hypothetical protein
MAYLDGEEPGMKNFSDLSEQEILALAITLEEEDERIYDEFAEGLRESYPASTQIFRDMAAEESTHRHRLIELHRARFGEHIPLITSAASGVAVDDAQQRLGVPCGARLPCSRLRTASTGTPMRRASATWDKPTVRRTRRT